MREKKSQNRPMIIKLFEMANPNISLPQKQGIHALEMHLLLSFIFLCLHNFRLTTFFTSMWAICLPKSGVWHPLTKQHPCCEMQTDMLSITLLFHLSAYLPDRPSWVPLSAIIHGFWPCAEDIGHWHPEWSSQIVSFQFSLSCYRSL